ncbi:MAG: WG repeat-containing protein, partial [Oscillospiraceae bacterium]|nr:WG repeat-containing protein [Oscillospiraceae bacterium]
INTSGNFSIKPQFLLADKFGKDGLAPIIQDGWWKCIDINGKIVIEFPRIGLSYLTDFNENGLAWVRTFDYNDPIDGTIVPKEKWGIIDKTGNFVIEPQIHYVDFYDDGYTVVKIDEKFGVVDSKGNYIVEPRFNAMWSDIKELEKEMDILRDSGFPVLR